MKRWLITLAALALLSLPLTAVADESEIPAYLNWTPTPPAGETVDIDYPTMGQLMEVLVKKGVMTPQEQASLSQREVAMSAGKGRETVAEPDASYLLSP